MKHAFSGVVQQTLTVIILMVAFVHAQDVV